VRRILIVTLAVGLVLGLASPSWGAQARTRVASRTGNGTLGDNDSFNAVVSASGRFVAFQSDADNLPGDDNFSDIYRKDMKTGALRLVSRTRGGEPANGGSLDPSISGNGRFVAFTTEADNLPGGSGLTNAVVKDMRTRRVLLISRTSGGEPANEDSADPSISATGRFVAFESEADNLPGDAIFDVFIHDLETRRTRLVSKTSSGEPANGGDCNDAVVSSNGRLVAFECEDTTNMPGQGAASGDQTYVHDRKTGKTRLVSKTIGGAPADGDSENPSISGNGRYVAFDSEDGTNLPGALVATGDQSYVHDRQTGRTRLVSKTTGGDPADGDSEEPAISRNGRYVAFESTDSTNLPQATAWFQVYRHDRERGRTILISRNNAGEAADSEAELTEESSPISADGSFVVFASGADNLGGGSGFFQAYRRGPLA
jgi:Tol biopolymer transport system component